MIIQSKSRKMLEKIDKIFDLGNIVSRISECLRKFSDLLSNHPRERFEKYGNKSPKNYWIRDTMVFQNITNDAKNLQHCDVLILSACAWKAFWNYNFVLHRRSSRPSPSCHICFHFRPSDAWLNNKKLRNYFNIIFW